MSAETVGRKPSLRGTHLDLGVCRGAAWGMAGLFFVAGMVCVRSHVFLNNEGVLTWIFSGLMSESPEDMLFLMKARPPISLLYAPVAAVGFKPFLYLHLFLSALAVPLTASLARRFGHAHPNFSAALVATSPLYFAAGVSGVQNADATLGTLCSVWLLACGRPVAAGLLLGAVVLGRVETSVFAVGLVFFALFSARDRGFLLALPVVPVLFVLCGAFYHDDFLWPLHYPSSVWGNPVFDAEERAGFGGSLTDLASAVLALLPAAGILAWSSLRGSSLEAAAVLTALGFGALLRLLPFTQLVWVDANPRYILPVMPFMALAAGRAFERLGGERQDTIIRAAVLVAVVAVLCAGVKSPIRPLLLVGVLVCGAAAFLARLWRAAAAAALIALALAEAWPLFPSTRLFLGNEARQLEQVVRWIAAEVPPGGVVVTDQHLLAIWLAERHPLLKVEVRHLVQPDMVYEADKLMNPVTPQRERFFGTSRFFYARWIFLEEIAALPGEVFLAMRTDSPRRQRVLSASPLDRARWLEHGEGWRGGRLLNGPR